MKRIAVFLLAFCMAFTMAGCDGAAGRDSGKTFDAEGYEQSLSTAFFDFQVNSARMASELDDYYPSDENNSFLIVNITVNNTFKDDSSIPMFDTDFELSWPTLEGQTIFCEDNFATDQLPEEYEIFKGESRTGNLIFVVPSSQSNFTLEYLEIYEDEFEGNTYKITFDVAAE